MSFTSSTLGSAGVSAVRPLELTGFRHLFGTPVVLGLRLVGDGGDLFDRTPNNAAISCGLLPTAFNWLTFIGSACCCGWPSCTGWAGCCGCCCVGGFHGSTGAGAYP